MWLRIRGVKAPATVKPNTPFIISFYGRWLTLTPWRRVTIGFKIFTGGDTIFYVTATFVPWWFWGKTATVFSQTLTITKSTKYILDIGRFR